MHTYFPDPLEDLNLALISEAAEFRDHINSRKIFLFLTELLVNAHESFSWGTPEIKYIDMPPKLVSNQITDFSGLF